MLHPGSVSRLSSSQRNRCLVTLQVARKTERVRLLLAIAGAALAISRRKLARSGEEFYSAPESQSSAFGLVGKMGWTH